MKLSLVVPCYNEEGNVKAFADACAKAFDGHIASYEIVFINDGSKDGTWEQLKKLKSSSGQNIKLVNFSRNFGKEAAMYAGLRKAEGEYVTIIDADLQQRPEIVVEMVDLLDNNEKFDSIAAYQAERKEGKVVSFFKKCFYKLINKISDIEFYPGASDFRTFRRPMVNAILEITECHRFSKGIFSWVGFNTYYIPYTVEARNAGASSWSMKKLFKYAVEGITAFTVFPLKVSTFAGVLLAVAALIYMLVVIIQKLAVGIAVPGYATIVVLILLIGGIQLISLGVIGEYISRIYIQGKNRPIYIIKEYIKSEPEVAEDQKEETV